MREKTSVITGANSGLGLATAHALAGQGSTVIMLCRSEDKGETARRKVIEATGNDAVHLIIADLASQNDIRRAAGQIRLRWPRVDVLINNAAAIHSQRKLTEDGVEMQFAVNHLAPFLLTHLLLPALLEGPEGRVVNVGSHNHYRARIHLNDLQLAHRYHILRAYGQSKLANLLFTYELDRRRRQKGLEELMVNCADPGLNDTAIGNKGTSILHSLAWRFRRMQAQSPDLGAASQVHLASSPELKGVSGQYWYNMQPQRSSPRSYNEQTARQLWERSKALCNIIDYFNP